MEITRAAKAIAIGILVSGSLGTGLVHADQTTAPTVVKKAPSPLRWSPPSLTSPITIVLSADVPTTNQLDKAKDYIIKLPAQKKMGGVMLEGGHNVVIQGGYITVPPGAPSESLKRGIYIKNATGTVHIEGVKIDNSGGGSDFDGIAIAAPDAIVQIENVRITGLTGDYKGYHADVVQPWGGLKELRIDHLTGTCNYQGLQVPADLAPIGSAIIQNVNLGYVHRDDKKYGYLLWLTHGLTDCTTYPIQLSNVYIMPRPDSTYTTGAMGVWPSTVKPGECVAVQNGDEISWPKTPTITGIVKQGTPPDGDFVPEDTAGLNYTSPGYLAAGGAAK